MPTHRARRLHRGRDVSLSCRNFAGAQALAVLDHRTGTTYLCRDDNRPLWVCRLRDRRRVIYASTPKIIARAVETRLSGRSFQTTATSARGVCVGDVLPAASPPPCVPSPCAPWS